MFVEGSNVTAVTGQENDDAGTLKETVGVGVLFKLKWLTTVN